MNIAVSILTSNYDEEETIERINKTDASELHVDVMDGHFVSNKTSFIHLEKSKKKLDIHLMVSRPFEYISRYALFKNAEYIVIHVELEDNLEDLLSYIKSRGLKCGLAINPNTPISQLNPYLELIDEVLLMSVEPGAGAQKMLDNVEDRLRELVDIRNRGYNFRIVVDGGVNDQTVDRVKMADVVVSGSFICKSEDYQKRLDQLRLSKDEKKC